MNPEALLIAMVPLATLKPKWKLGFRFRRTQNQNPSAILTLTPRRFRYLLGLPYQTLATGSRSVLDPFYS